MPPGIDQVVQALGQIVEQKVNNATQHTFQAWTTEWNNRQVPTTVSDVASRMYPRPITVKEDHATQIAETTAAAAALQAAEVGGRVIASDEAALALLT